MPKSLLVYPHFGGWAFDDAEHGLVAEPFVMGADKVIQVLFEAFIMHGVKAQPFPFLVEFDKDPFMAWQLRLGWRKHDDQCSATIDGVGDWYEVEVGARGEHGLPLQAWLCPALLHYFPEAPKEIYARALFAEGEEARR